METEGSTDNVSVRDRLQRAARDLWSQVIDLGESYVVFIDRRGLHTRVELGEDGFFRVSWQDEPSWITFPRTFENPREAALHAYQGPHD
ncbi:MAG TPA: hypothetical protein VF898_03870 [Chloroflexota bacterium]